MVETKARERGGGSGSRRGRGGERGGGRGGGSAGHRASKPHAQRKHGQDDDEDEDEDAAELEDGTGVNKIKAALRQTKRLLSKETLSASGRQEAERKLAALEDELERRTVRQRERKNATRYHKVRFFERQKLTRRIGKLRKQLDGKVLEEDKRAKLEADLQANRVLLNYVLHYPMTQKYVALFPNHGPSPLDEEGDAEDAESKVSRERMQAVRERIVAAMQKGDLSAKPDEELEQRAGQVDAEEDGEEATAPTTTTEKKRKTITLPEAPEKSDKKAKRTLDKGGSSTTTPSKKTKTKAAALQDDDFFAAGSDDD